MKDVGYLARVPIHRISDHGIAFRGLISLNENSAWFLSLWNNRDSTRRFVFILRHPVDPHRTLSAAARDDAVDRQRWIFRGLLLFLDVELSLAIKGLPAFRAEEQSAERFFGACGRADGRNECGD